MADRPRADVELGMLRVFVAVARGGSVTEAARRLGRTQPSVSSRLDGLERHWGTRLFRRVARGMELTPEGARLLPGAEAILARAEALDREASGAAAAESPLRVGAGDALGRVRLPAALSRLRTAGGVPDLRLREGSGPVLLDALRRGEIDVALIVLDPDDASPRGLGGVRIRPLLRSSVLVLQPDEGEGPAPRGRSPRGLRGEALIALQADSAFRRHVERAFAAADVPFRPSIEVGNLSLVRRFVAAGLGVAPVPAVAFEGPAPPEGCLVSGMTGIDDVVYAAATRDGAPLPAAATVLLRAMESGG